ncbi:acetyl-CoA carboxylase biotin carboxylase subunit [Acidisphaera sp. L21]|uniref:acetyl-CoA carboxylase biotin carboxylase subunit n=1 Tax=Acidisphaera sp. L21 TaxID=1641851 RepID=UPI00131DF78B|nr:acetyl-CoA carboxylase biotin carboxylase subunit [Acidisphaera sp. L21]
MFRTILIANRGEIAVRIMRACRQMDIRTVAVFSEADAGASYLRLADRAVCIGPAPTQRSYGDPAVILLAAEATGAEAIHPGYGFLSENAEFARQVEEAGLAFIGPPSHVIAMMGDKIAAKRAMLAAGVPCVPGSDGALPSDPAALQALAAEIGFPLLVKAAAGGGGRGMRVVDRAADLQGAVALTQQEAQQFFGSPEVYAERYLRTPRHVEIQVMCDKHGNAVWLGERDCSSQRRHQKLLEETPAPGIDRDLVRQVGERCVAACQQIGYVGAGTFEFLFEDGQFNFIEMNTRLQVEHTVTEAVTGRDLVQAQIRVAAGESLPWRQDEITSTGHAMECRINAEDPVSFAPSPGRITRWNVPGGPYVRFDTHMSAGDTVPRHYDSMVAKLIAHAPTRAEAIRAMDGALAELQVEGVLTNRSLHRRILADPDFRAGGVSIHHLETRLAHWRGETTERLDDRRVG